MSNELKKECGKGYYWCNTDKACKPLQESMETTKFCPACNKMEKRSECAFGPEYFDKYAEPMKKEDAGAMGAPTNAVGGGQIAGIGVGPQGEPGVKKRKTATFISFIKRKTNVAD
jgi:ribosomal protein L33